MSISNGQQCCPSRSDLKRFNFGGLPESALGRVAEHIAGCLRCIAALDELDSQADPLLADIREPLPHSLAEIEQGHHSVVEKILASTVPTTSENSRRATLDEAPPDLIGHAILAKIGEGGMGVVWRALNQQFQVLVAVKVMRAAKSPDPSGVRRFFAEARITAQLAHPSIVPVHNMGQLEDGRPYYTMKLVEGKTLGELLKAEFDLTPRRMDFLQVFLPICQALAFAHRKGVIHRDLKPRNVMLGERGEVYVMDWGVAKALDESEDLLAEELRTRVPPGARDRQTQNGDILGTFSYMPPEQANGRTKEIDRRSDVFGLGGILCEILTGQPPYRGPTKLDVVRQACDADLADAYARLEKCGADAELIALARACLSANPNDRPSDASTVEKRLTGYLYSVQERLRRAELEKAKAMAKAAAERRARWFAVLTAGFFACSLALFVGMVFFAQRAFEADQQHLADTIDKALTAAMSGDLEAAEQAIAEVERAGASTGQVRMLHGQITLHRGKTQEAIRHLEQAVRLLPDSVAARGMLAAAYASDGHWERYDNTIREMNKLTPATPEDFLFKGSAEAWLDPELGLKTVQHAFDRRPMTCIALLLRAEMRALRAQDIDDLQIAAAAVQDAKFARELLGDKNAAALWVSLNAHLVKAGVHEHRKEDKERLAALELAGKDAKALELFTALPEAVIYRWLYFREFGKESEPNILKELREASKQTDHMYVTFCYALTLYRRGIAGDLKDALDVLKKKPGSYNDRLLPFVLAEHDYHAKKPNWQASALEASEDYAKRFQDGLALMNAQSVLYLLGKKEDAVRASSELGDQKDRFYTLRREPILRCLEYSVGARTADELVKVAKGHQWDLCLAHYSIGMTKLSEGDREGARVHFDKVVKTRAFNWGTYDMSWVFQARLEKDPTWPPWIPAK